MEAFSSAEQTRPVFVSKPYKQKENGLMIKNKSFVWEEAKRYIIIVTHLLSYLQKLHLYSVDTHAVIN